MHDFSKKYRGVQHFGLWAEEAADGRGTLDAFTIVQLAAARTGCYDLRKDERVMHALEWLERHGAQTPARAYRAALSIEDPVQRHYALQMNVERLHAKLMM